MEVYLGDLEKQLGIPVSPFMDRDSPPGPSAQKGFISFIVYPLFEALECWTPLNGIKTNLNASRERFRDPISDIPMALLEIKNSLKPLKINMSLSDPITTRSANDLVSPTRRASMITPRRSSVVQSLRNVMRSRSGSVAGLPSLEDIESNESAKFLEKL